jgi:hypothetical protein
MAGKALNKAQVAALNTLAPLFAALLGGVAQPQVQYTPSAARKGGKRKGAKKGAAKPKPPTPEWLLRRGANAADNKALADAFRAKEHAYTNAEWKLAQQHLAEVKLDATGTLPELALFAVERTLAK